MSDPYRYTCHICAKEKKDVKDHVCKKCTEDMREAGEAHRRQVDEEWDLAWIGIAVGAAIILAAGIALVEVMQ